MAEAASNSCASGFCLGLRPRGVYVEARNGFLTRKLDNEGTLGCKEARKIAITPDNSDVLQQIDFGPEAQAGENKVELKVDGKVADSHAMPRSLPITLPWDETFNVGLDTGTPVDDQDYQVPFRFTGKIAKLTVKLGPKEISAGEQAKIEKDKRDRQ